MKLFCGLLARWHSGIVVGRRTCNQEVASSAWCSFITTRQVIHTHVPLSPTSIIRYWRKLGCEQAHHTTSTLTPYPWSQRKLVSGWGLQKRRSACSQHLLPDWYNSLLAAETMLFWNVLILFCLIMCNVHWHGWVTDRKSVWPVKSLFESFLGPIS